MRYRRSCSRLTKRKKKTSSLHSHVAGYDRVFRHKQILWQYTCIDFRNSRIGFVFQFHHLLPEFTALENVMMPALIAVAEKRSSLSAHAVRERALEILSSVGLGERVSHRPAQMSGGEQQRVAIARALINNPAVLFADEPSGNLDSRTKEELHSLFFDLRAKLGQTIVIVTHDRELAKRSDRTLEMRDGEFI